MARTLLIRQLDQLIAELEKEYCHYMACAEEVKSKICNSLPYCNKPKTMFDTLPQHGEEQNDNPVCWIYGEKAFPTPNFPVAFR